MRLMPEQIEGTACLLATQTRALAESRERWAELEAAEVLAIAQAQNAAGKPAFTNEAARHAELVLRLSRQPESRALKELMTETEAARQQTLALLERQRNEFKVALLERQAELAFLS